jgi:NAD(P)-dependent dehydrogenase (short-subunit alcohol dehydrogenase family)
MGIMDGKVCVATGAGGSIGLASARRFAAEGAKVTVVDIDPAKVDAAVEVLGAGDALGIAADVTDAAATRDYIARTVERFGKIDVLFSNAGMSGEIKPITLYDEEVFDRVMAVNVKASFLICKYGLPEMNDGGSIVMTSSIMGVTSSPGVVGYSTSKHALIGLMRVVALENAERNIRVNAIAPGPVSNEFQTDIEVRLGQAIGGNGTDFLNQRIPMKRHASAEEIAETVLFLASDRSSFCTGSVFNADGGLNV